MAVSDCVINAMTDAVIESSDYLKDDSALTVEQRQSGFEKGDRAHTGQIWYFYLNDSTRRYGALSGWNGAHEPWRHGNGSGLLQSCTGCGV